MHILQAYYHQVANFLRFGEEPGERVSEFSRDIMSESQSSEAAVGSRESDPCISLIPGDLQATSGDWQSYHTSPCYILPWTVL